MFERDYWLAHCEGFLVEADGGRVGYVESILDGAAEDVPVLVVRAGRLGRRLLLVAAADVAFVVPRAERIWLSAPVRILASAAA